MLVVSLLFQPRLLSIYAGIVINLLLNLLEFLISNKAGTAQVATPPPPPPAQGANRIKFYNYANEYDFENFIKLTAKNSRYVFHNYWENFYQFHSTKNDQSHP